MMQVYRSAFMLVFSSIKYIVIAASIAIVMFTLLSYLAEFLFFEPYMIYHVEPSYVGSFIAIIIISILSSIVISMNIFRFRRFKGLSMTGSIIGISAGACSCGPVGFGIISILGGAGGVLSAFLANYELPLRILSIAILLYTYHITGKSFKPRCKI